MTRDAIAPPMPYSGGKQRSADRIACLFPGHGHYVEPFAGALSVLLAKPRSHIETVNDINGHLITFWRVLRDRPDDLERVCALTPHSRQEYRSAVDVDGCDDLEIARRVWVQLTQARGARLGRVSGWRFVHGMNRMSLARYLNGYLARIAPAAERLREVSIECRDAMEVIDAYGRKDALLYVDPPYLMSTRHGNQYLHEFGSVDQHTALIDALLRTPAKVVLSGYASRLYDEALKGWHRYQFAGQTMTGSASTEVVWCNYAPPATLPFGGDS